MRIMVLGATGMLGHKVYQSLSASFPDTYATFSPQSSHSYAKITLFPQDKVIRSFDALDWERAAGTVRELRPDVIVNCIGIIKQRDDAKSAVPSIAINSLLPHRLAQISETWKGRVIHFSTDCVFRGDRGNYTEEDVADAEDLYGRTKSLGEMDHANTITLRTSIIGRELAHFQSLLEWFLAQEGRTIQGYTRALYSGVTTNYLAGLVNRLIRQHPDLHGLYQVTGNTISKFDLLCLLREKFKLKVDIIPNDTFFCDRSMVGEKFQKATGYVTPDWPTLIDELVNDPTPYKEWR